MGEKTFLGSENFFWEGEKFFEGKNIFGGEVKNFFWCVCVKIVLNQGIMKNVVQYNTIQYKPTIQSLSLIGTSR